MRLKVLGTDSVTVRLLLVAPKATATGVNSCQVATLWRGV